MKKITLYLKTLKQMKTTIYLLFFILFLAINSCCRKPECKCEDEWGQRVEDCTPKHYGPYYLGEVKDYLYFKKGSWWVYKNNLSGETDSIYTVYCDTSVVNSTNSTFRWLTMTYTDIGFRLKSEKYNTTYTYSQPYITASYNFTNFKYQLNRNADFPTKSRTFANFAYPFEVNGSGLFQELIPSMTIQGKNYNDVAVFQVSRDEGVQYPLNISYSLYYKSSTKYYWAKGVGLVLMISDTYRNDNNLPVQSKWELINYNLIK